ncbi:MAG: DUF3039 domain-containing protein [Acidimicrobiales bacterium]|nr:DUF3039 domain-containing protein [Acidimicrobiales bacterium]
MRSVRATDPSPSPTPTITPDTTPQPSTGDGDDEEYAHICRKDDVTRAYITGEAIEALCGKKWVPSRDPDNYPVCPACKDAMGRVQNADSN